LAARGGDDGIEGPILAALHKFPNPNKKNPQQVKSITDVSIN